jgi:ketosteroid isomerase-like protein
MMSDSFPLPTKPEDVVPSFIERFKSGRISEVMALFDPKAVFVDNDGRTIAGHADIAARLERDVVLGLPVKTVVRHVFAGEDLAQLVVDWSIDGTGPDGKDVHLGGTACDVVRRGADGFWRFIIDNNQGTAVRKPA